MPVNQARLVLPVERRGVRRHDEGDCLCICSHAEEQSQWWNKTTPLRHANHDGWSCPKRITSSPHHRYWLKLLTGPVPVSRGFSQTHNNWGITSSKLHFNHFCTIFSNFLQIVLWTCRKYLHHSCPIPHLFCFVPAASHWTSRIHASQKQMKHASVRKCASEYRRKNWARPLEFLSPPSGR